MSDDIELQLVSAIYDGRSGVTLHAAWDGKPLIVKYWGGEYAEVQVGGYAEAIHHYENHPTRLAWNTDKGMDTKVALLYTEMDEWCRTADKENPGWYEQFKEYAGWE